MKLGEKIKLLRIEKKLTQPELAEKAAIEQSYLSKLENDKSIPSFDIIKRIAMSLEMTGIELVDSLSQSYVENHLAHIPEVAAEYATIRYKREISTKRRFIAAAFAIVLGIGVFLSGAFLEKKIWYYESNGVVKDGELIEQFSLGFIREISETQDERIKRKMSNRDRWDKKFRLSNEYKGSVFIENIAEGRRLYRLKDSSKSLNNNLIGVQSIIGIMMIASGLFAFLFNIRFRAHRT